LRLTNVLTYLLTEFLSRAGLTNLAMMSIERDLAEEIDSDDVISELAIRKA